MPFKVLIADRADRVLDDLEHNPAFAAKYRKVVKALRLLAENPRHPGLNVHLYHSKTGPGGEPVWEAYVENRTPGAWRIWFWYGPDRNELTILAIGPHPD